MADNQSGNTPAAPTGEAPKPGEQTPSQPASGTPAAGANQGDTITLTKEQHSELSRQAAQAATAQRDADTLRNKYERRGRKVEPLEPLKAQEVASITQKVSAKVLQSKVYRELLDKDPTLARVIVKNPLDLLDTDEFVDEDDAISQVLDYLDDRNAAAGTAPSSTPAKPTTPVVPVVAPASVNPGDEVTPTELSPEQKMTEEQKAAQAKLPPMQRITNKLASRIKIT